MAKKQEVAEDLFLLWLRPDEPFRFKPGQYITIGTGGIERPYSIASAPYESLIELFVEYVLPEYGGKLTPLLWNLHVGDEVSMRPRAKGLFVFQPQYHHHLMLGTVTGVAPYMSMIRQALRDNTRGHHFYVMEGASHQDEFVYDSELLRLAERMPDIVTFVTTVSRPAGRAQPQLERPHRQGEHARRRVHPALEPPEGRHRRLPLRQPRHDRGRERTPRRAGLEHLRRALLEGRRVGVRSAEENAMRANDNRLRPPPVR